MSLDFFALAAQTEKFATTPYAYSPFASIIALNSQINDLVKN